MAGGSLRGSSGRPVSVATQVPLSATEEVPERGRTPQIVRSSLATPDRGTTVSKHVSWKSIRDKLIGRPLATGDADEQRIGARDGVPVLGLDALASAAYGPEAALTILLPLGVAGPPYASVILLLIVGLLIIVQTSYRQTITAYPNGGGSYTVAKQNMGVTSGLLAGAALFVDYVVNVAVAISAGVGALISAVPSLQPHTLSLCLLILLVLAVVNLRGVRDSGLAFLIPTYGFIALVGGILAFGVIRTIIAGGQPTPVDRPPPLAAAAATGSLWLFIRAFSSGCTAMTGIEAVSNAVPIFREPRVVNARRTLTTIVVVLTLLIAGLAVVCRAYGIGATPPGRAGYESVLSQAIAAVAGRGFIYYTAIGATMMVLCLSANTSFADFPRLGRLLAQDGFLPVGFAHQGPRLVYSYGIVLLTVLGSALLIAFGGVTDRLIPLFAVGAFLAFTMSQLGMVAHWLKTSTTDPRERRRQRTRLIVNAIGATATGATLVIIIISKFEEGAWVTVFVLAGLILTFRRVRAHLAATDHEIVIHQPVSFAELDSPLVVVPLKRLDKLAAKALRFACSISTDVLAVQVLAANQDERDLTPIWATHVEQPARQAGIAVPKLLVLRSPYREVVEPLVTHVQRLATVTPNRPIAVLVPELVERRWYQLFLHSQTAALLKALLLRRGGPQVVVINTPWHVGVPTRARRRAQHDRMSARRTSGSTIT